MPFESIDRLVADLSREKQKEPYASYNKEARVDKENSGDA